MSTTAKNTRKEIQDLFSKTIRKMTIEAERENCISALKTIMRMISLSYLPLKEKRISASLVWPKFIILGDCETAMLIQSMYNLR